MASQKPADMDLHCFQTEYIWVQHGRGSFLYYRAEIILSYFYSLVTLIKDMLIQHP